eukprot:jgi/Hompol1/1986/HPOL_001720-RA
MDDLEVALAHAKRLEPGKPLPKGPVKKLKATDKLMTEGIIAMVQQFGESFSLDEIGEAFHELTAEQQPYFGKIPSKLAVRELIEGVLGLSPANPEDAVAASAAAAAAADKTV